MLLAELVATSAAVSATSSRLDKVGHIAAVLRSADTDEVGLVVSYLSGELRQRRTGVGYAALRSLPSPAEQPSLGVSGVDAAFELISQVSGKGSQAERQRLLTDLMGRATHDEQRFLASLIAGELRQGALDGVMVDAVIRTGEAPAADVRRAVMLAGAVQPVAVALLAEGAGGLARFRLELGRPVRPMLASSSPDMDTALERLGERARALPGTIRTTGSASEEPNATGKLERLGERARALPGTIRTTGSASEEPNATGKLEKLVGEKLPGEVALEWKLDGIRVQVHRVDDQITIYTRTLDDVTARLPEVVEAVAALPASELILDGEVIALDADDRPHPFQVTASRTGSKTDVERLRATVPVRPFFFDLLHLDGADLLGAEEAERWAALARVVPEHQRVPRLVTADPAEAGRFFADAVDRGHEGVVAKALDTPYEAGRRGSSWIKVKPRHTLDLVVLAVEWGHGRRTGLLSNLHLGARDPETGGFVMLGKTFKGLTDETLRWQTERLLELEDHRDDWTVYVRPELVVEIAFDGVQNSSRYPGGMALRFARVIRYRPDKTVEEADTVHTVRTLHHGKLGKGPSLDQ